MYAVTHHDLIAKLGPIQTSNFTCAESNANETEFSSKQISIRKINESIFISVMDSFSFLKNFSSLILCEYPD